MRMLLASLLFTAAPAFAGQTYRCDLSVRASLNQETVTKQVTFNGSKTVEEEMQSFTFKLIPTYVNGKDHMGIWLGEDDAHSAVTSGPMGQAAFYVNLVQGEHLGVVECKLSR